MDKGFWWYTITRTACTVAAILALVFLVSFFITKPTLGDQPATQSVVTLYDSGVLIKEYMSEGGVEVSQGGRVRFTDVETGRRICIVGGSVLITDLGAKR